MSKVYPLYFGTALLSAYVATQCVVDVMCMERNWSMWRLGFIFAIRI